MFLIDMNDEERVAPGASLIHACEGYFAVHGPAIHGLEHMLAGGDADLSAVLNEYSSMFILFDL